MSAGLTGGYFYGDLAVKLLAKRFIDLNKGLRGNIFCEIYLCFSHDRTSEIYNQNPRLSPPVSLDIFCDAASSALCRASFTAAMTIS